MRRVFLLTAVTLLIGLVAAPPAARATEVGTSRTFGLGFAIGDPTSIVGKYFLNPSNAIDFGIAFYNYDNRYCGRGPYRDCDGLDYVSFNADYLWQETIARGTARLDWHIGAGGRIAVNDRYDDSLMLAARMPVGLDLMFDKPSFVEAFVELAPMLVIVPGTHFDVEAFIGVRFYF
jgi:hypothetical protein